MEEQLRELRGANEAVMEKCEFSAEDNNKITGDSKWWGPADLVGYLVHTVHHSTVQYSTVL